MSPSQTPIPAAATWLGGAGLIPFAALAVSGLAGGPIAPGAAIAAEVAYGAVILSFMGGVHWGLAMRRTETASPHRHATLQYGASVLPALLAWGCLLADRGKLALLMLAAGFVALLVFDIWTVGSAMAPAWYRGLRIRLTAGVLGCLALSAAA